MATEPLLVSGEAARNTSSPVSSRLRCQNVISRAYNTASYHKSNMAADCCVFKFLRRSFDGKHLMHFQSETSVFKFLRRSQDGAKREIRLMFHCDNVYYLHVHLRSVCGYLRLVLGERVNVIVTKGTVG